MKKANLHLPWIPYRCTDVASRGQTLIVSLCAPRSASSAHAPLQLNWKCRATPW